MADKYTIIKATANRKTDSIDIEAVNNYTGKTVITYGWVSATENYYDVKDYDNSGNLIKKAHGRKMNDDEIRQYIMALVEQADAATPEPPVEGEFINLFTEG